MTCEQDTPLRALVPLCFLSAFNGEHGFLHGFAPADGAFPGLFQPAPLTENKAAPAASRRHYHKLVLALVHGLPDVLQMFVNVSFRDPEPVRQISSRKRPFSQERGYSPPKGLIPFLGYNRFLCPSEPGHQPLARIPYTVYAQTVRYSTGSLQRARPGSRRRSNVPCDRPASTLYST